MNYLNAGYGLKSWLLTLDHKRVAWLYFISITGFFFLGGAAATLVRLELITPAGDLLAFAGLPARRGRSRSEPCLACRGDC